MGSLKTLALAGAAIITTIPAARAADLPPAYRAPPVVVEEFAGGWYLRGDIGISSKSVKDTKYDFGTLAPPTSVQTVTKDFETDGIFGLGIGYQFNHWFRADLTAEYRSPATFHGYEINRFGQTLIPEHNTAVMHSFVAMANVYADLGTWWCITPFVGAGAGMAYNKLSGFQDFVIGGLNPGNGFLVNANNSADADGKWNFAWALHAGLAYKVTPGFTVELAYRYLNLGDAATGTPISGFDGTYQGAKYELNNISSHDVKLGVRWMLMPESAPPLVRKG